MQIRFEFTAEMLPKFGYFEKKVLSIAYVILSETKLLAVL